jgi:transposase
MKEEQRVTQKDWLRIDLVQQAASGQRTAPQVAQALGLSVRQVRRLILAFRKKGAEGLIHGNRGKVSPARLAPETREEVLRLIRTEYADYNTAQLRDDLETYHGMHLSYSALYRLRREAGLASPRRHKAQAHRTRRQRAAQEGLLLQADGSPHAWLEDRGPRLTLIAYIDDATNRVVGATFREQEDVVGYLSVLQDICTTRGVPHYLYTDRHSLFGPPPEATIAQKLRNEPLRSQIQRVLDALGIVRIPAHSPQAKGRVERLFGTLQDRLVKELRRAGARTCAEANRVLAAYLSRFNARFARPPAEEVPAYRPWPQGLVAPRIFCLRYERTVSLDNTIAFGGLHLPLPPSPQRRHYARARVEVCLQLDGCLQVYYQEECIARFAHAPDVPVRVDQFVPATPIAYPQTALPPVPAPVVEDSVPRTAQPPAANHPWRRSPIGRRARPPG